jgi:hypothetical protein
MKVRQMIDWIVACGELADPSALLDEGHRGRRSDVELPLAETRCEAEAVEMLEGDLTA